MTDRKPVRTDVTPADMDPQGNVVVWDHGPPEPPADLDRASPEYQALVADANAWHKRHGDGPAPITMHASDAGHAITVDPDRYALEPFDIDDAEVEAEVEAIQQRRAEAEKAAAEHATAVQVAADRKVAIATVMARRMAKKDDEPAPKPEPQPVPVPAPAPVPPAPQPKTVAEVRRAAEEKPLS